MTDETKPTTDTDPTEARGRQAFAARAEDFERFTSSLRRSSEVHVARTLTRIAEALELNSLMLACDKHPHLRRPMAAQLALRAERMHARYESDYAPRQPDEMPPTAG